MYIIKIINKKKQKFKLKFLFIIHEIKFFY